MHFSALVSVVCKKKKNPHCFVYYDIDAKNNLATFIFVGEHIKVGTGRSGEGAGLLLQQAARGGAAVPGAG